MRGASGSADLSRAHLQLQLAKVGLATERYRVLGQGLKLARAVVGLLIVGVVLWVTYALRLDLTLIVKEMLADVLGGER
jgi:hypothetical protein